MVLSHRGTFSIAGPMVLLCLLLAGTMLGCKASTAEVAADEKESAEESLGLAVRAEPAERRAMAQWVQGLGSCEALPEKIATLAPAVGGQVRKILLEQGRAVQAGEPIIELDPTVAQASLNEKKAACDALEASLRLLESLPRPEEQQSYRLAIESAKAAVERAAASVERLQPLRQRGEIPQQQMFEAELALRQAKLQQQTAESQFSVAMLGPRAQAVDEAKAHIATAEAALASAKVDLDLHTIHAPIAGVLDSISCRLGQTLAAGNAVGEIVDSRQLHVVVWLPAADARLVRVGQPARITPSEARSGEAHAAEAAGEQLSGEVKFVGQVVDPQTGNLPVRILIDNPTGRLALGETAAAAINVRQQADVLVVPAQAIEDLGEGPLLSVIRKGKSVLLHPRLGVKENGWVEIAELKAGEDLKAGELVIVEGGYNLPEGTKVSVQSAAESETEGKAESKAESQDGSAGAAHSGAAP